MYSRNYYDLVKQLYTKKKRGKLESSSLTLDKYICARGKALAFLNYRVDKKDFRKKWMCPVWG